MVSGIARTLLVGWVMLSGATPALGVELCSEEARGLMRQSGIAPRKIEALCRLVSAREAPLVISLLRSEDELGYCRLTLALQNNSSDYLNSLTLSSAKGLYEIFNFNNIQSGKTGYASAKSRILVECNEVSESGVVFHWPASLRVGDRAPRGSGLERYKPVFLTRMLQWKQ